MQLLTKGKILKVQLTSTQMQKLVIQYRGFNSDIYDYFNMQIYLKR